MPTRPDVAYEDLAGRAASGPAGLVLLSRAYCGLCDTMRDAARALAAPHGATLEEIDVDAHPALEARWGDLVPVLFLGSPDPAHELCHYHFDARRVAAALSQPARAAPKTA